MCDYNSQKVAHTQFSRLKGIEKLEANYDCLNTSLLDGLAYGYIAMGSPMAEKPDFEIVKMEWGLFLQLERPGTSERNRNGFRNARGKWGQYTTLNATHKNMLLSCEYWMADQGKKIVFVCG